MGTLATLPPEREMQAAASNVAGDRRFAAERWMEEHLSWLAMAVVIGGFILRWVTAWGTYLNPDEALHYGLSNQPSLWEAYRASLTNAHPPLLFLVLYGWEFLGRSEWMLRLPSVLAGTWACWFSFEWMKRAFGKAAALIGVVLFASCPALVEVSGEIRQYALLLLFVTSSLFFLTRALEEKSARLMWSFSVSLYLAILSHYSALFFVAAIGVYATVRIAGERPAGKVVGAWGIGQLGAAALYVLLYFTHVSKLKGQAAVWGSSFVRNYFSWKYDDPWLFVKEHTSEVLLYLFREEYVAQFLLFALVAGVVLLFASGFANGVVPGGSRERSFDRVILVVLPFFAVVGAAMAGVYPYVGSRHTIVLAPFVIAAASVFLAWVVRQRLWAGVLMALTLMSVSLAAKDVSGSAISRENQRLELMKSAMRYVEQQVPRGEPILIDAQSSLVLPYYLCGRKEMVRSQAHGEFRDIACGDFKLIATNFVLWKLMPENFQPAFEKMARAYELRPGSRVWIVQTGWGKTLAEALPARQAGFRCLRSNTFGKNIAVIAVEVGTDLQAVPAGGACESGLSQE